MISNELSLIQRNSAESASLAAQISAFIEQGGEIRCIDTPPPAPRARTPVLTARSVPRRRKERSSYDKFVSIADAQEKARLDQLNKVRELAKTMTVSDVQRATGIGRAALAKIARSCGFTFQPYKPGAMPSRYNAAADARAIELIKKAIADGLARSTAAQRLGIGRGRLDRLINDYGIDCPIRSYNYRR